MQGDKKLAKALASAQNPFGLRQGEIVSYDGGSPRTVTVDINGATVPGIPIVDNVGLLTAGDVLWMAEMGDGKMLGLFSQSVSGAVRLPASGEASLVSTTHPFQIGPSSGLNIVADTDEIQARNNSALSVLNLNPHGGNVVLGSGLIVAGAAAVASLAATGAVSGATVAGKILPSTGEGIKFATAGDYEAWFNGVTRIGYLQGNAGGLILNSETGRLGLNGLDGLQLAPFKINGYTASEGILENRLVVSTAAGYIVGNYINMTADVVAGYPLYMAGQNGDNYMRWYTMAGNWARVFQANRVEGMNSSPPGASAWASAALCANPGVGTAMMALHPGGVALTFLSQTGANIVWVRNANADLGSAEIRAAAFPIDSSRRGKKNIAPWPMRSVGAATERAVDVINRLRPVTFQRNHRDVEVPSLRRSKAHIRLNNMRAAKGIDPYELPEHDCAEHSCNGTVEQPCIRHQSHEAQRLGMIAEEVLEVLPNAVALELDGTCGGIDYAQVTVVAVAAIQELTARIATLEAALEKSGTN